jgi:8-oxo-dGTP pyrophosphatase MutT (NUDIX family)
MAEPTANPWRTVGSRTVYRNPWLSVREDRVIRPDGTDGIYGVVEIAPSCGIVAIGDDGRIALVGQWRYVHGRFSLEIPTGGSEAGETPLDAARRELAEETGLRAGRWTALGTVDNSNGVTTDVAHIFLARDLTAGPAAQAGNEPIELSWVPFPDAVRAVLAGEITESVSVAGILKAEILGLASRGAGAPPTGGARRRPGRWRPRASR